MNARKIVLTLMVGLTAAVLSDAAHGRETPAITHAGANARPELIRAGTCARNRTVVEQRACQAALKTVSANARETERQRRWALRKQLCRELNVRFDSSGRCW